MASVADLYQACGVHPSGPVVRDPAVQPSSVQPVRCPPRVRPDASVSSHLRRWRWDQVGAAGNLQHGNGSRSGWAAAPSTGSVDGGGGLDAGDAAEGPRRSVGLLVADSGRVVGRAAAVALDRYPARQARPACGAPVAGGRARAREQTAARRCRTGRVAAVLGWVRGDYGAWLWWGLPSGWTGPEGPMGVPVGMGVRPQRGPGSRQARPARCRQRSDLRCWVVGLPGLEPGTSSLSGIFAGCVQAGGTRGDQVTGGATVTVVVRWLPCVSL
jgi:hypothetical protein